MIDLSVLNLRKQGGSRSVEEAVLAAVREALRLESATPIDQIAAAYIADLTARAGASHVAKSEQQLRRILAECPTPTSGEVFLYRSARLRDGAARRTVEMEVGALRACCRWAQRAGLMPSDPLRDLSTVPIREGDRRRRPRAFDDQELALFLRAAARRWGVPQVPNWSLLAATGMRWGEAVKVTRADLDGDRIRLSAGATKARRARTVLLPEDLARYFRNVAGPLLLAPSGKPWLEVGHRGAHALFRRTLRAARIPHVSPDGRLLTIHSLRRTTATDLAREGVPMLAISRMLGHSSTAFTERWYLDTTAEDAIDAVREARRKKNSRDGDVRGGPDPRDETSRG